MPGRDQSPVSAACCLSMLHRVCTNDTTYDFVKKEAFPGERSLYVCEDCAKSIEYREKISQKKINLSFFLVQMASSVQESASVFKRGHPVSAFAKEFGEHSQKKSLSSSFVRVACCFQARNDIFSPPESAMSSPVYSVNNKSQSKTTIRLPQTALPGPVAEIGRSRPSETTTQDSKSALTWPVASSNKYTFRHDSSIPQIA